LPEPGAEGPRSAVDAGGTARDRGGPCSRPESARAREGPATRGGTAGPTPRPRTEDEAFRVYGGVDMPFEPVDPKVSFPHLEERILALWKQADVFHRSLVAREGAPRWVFYEGPPTANAQPGIHHVEPRTFKDVFPRFKTMTRHSGERTA